jgi:hypothetical protein
VTDKDRTTIHSRRITTQEYLEFDRLNGISITDNEVSIIDSVRPLPSHIHDAIMENPI